MPVRIRYIACLNINRDNHDIMTDSTDIATEQIIEVRRRLFPKCLYHVFEKPIEIVKARGQYYNDTILDLYNNVCHVGHSNPRVLESVTECYRDVNINTRYLHRNLTDYAMELSRYIPQGYKMLFVNSGSEANDLALRIAMTAHPERKLGAMEYSYHGTTYLCDKVGHLFSTGEFKQTYAPDVVFIPRNDIESLSKHGNQLAGFIVETIQGVGGNVPLDTSFLQKAFQHCHDHGIITIADEVQTGFGRTGHTFWSYEYSELVPDIITCGKPIANGYPMGAIIMRPDLADLLGERYFNTFGGNSVATSVALAVLKEIEAHSLSENSKRLGEFLIRELKTFRDVADVTGRGLFIGFRVRGRNSKEIVEELKQRNVIVGSGANGTIRVKPPLVVTEQDIGTFLGILSSVINAESVKPKTT